MAFWAAVWRSPPSAPMIVALAPVLTVSSGGTGTVECVSGGPEVLPPGPPFEARQTFVWLAPQGNGSTTRIV